MRIFESSHQGDVKKVTNDLNFLPVYFKVGTTLICKCIFRMQQNEQQQFPIHFLFILFLIESLSRKVKLCLREPHQGQSL